MISITCGRDTISGAPRAGGLILVALLMLAGCSKTPAPNPCEDTGTSLIAFASDRASAGQYDVYLYDLLGDGYHLLKDLNSAAADSSPALAANGRFVAFTTWRNGTADLALYDRQSCAFANLSAIDTDGNEDQPSFAADAVSLVFRRDTLGGHVIRMIVGTEPPAYVPLPGLTAAPGEDLSSPATDLHGNLIAYVASSSGSSAIRVYDRATGLARATPGLAASGSDVDPVLSPDGRWLVFASNRPDTTGTPGNFNLFLYDLSGDSLVAMPGVNSPGDERHPSISRSSDFIAFQSDRTAGNAWDLFLYQRSRASTRVLVPSAGSDVQPSLVLP